MTTALRIIADVMCTIAAMLRAATLAVVLLLLAPAAASAADVTVYLTRGEQLAYVQREADSPAEALEALLAGPTSAERAKGYGTKVPAGVRLTSARERGDTMEGALSTPLEEAARAQIVYTATGATEIEEVQIGGRTYTREDFGPGEYAAPKPPTARSPRPPSRGRCRPSSRELGYLPRSAVTGSWDYRTQQAVLAFQGWSNLDRDGIVGTMTRERLEAAGRPLALDRGPRQAGRDLPRRGVVLLIEAGQRRARRPHLDGLGNDSMDLGTPAGRGRSTARSCGPGRCRPS